MTDQELMRRWRLVLGRYAAPVMGDQGRLDREYRRLDQALDYLYSREYRERGLTTGGSEASQIRAVDWLNQTRKLFPQAVFERLQNQAIERYDMVELLNDPAIIDALEPSQAMVKTLLSMRGRLGASTGAAVKALIQKTIDEITQRLKPQVTQAIVGRKNRFRSGAVRSAQNFDWRRTIRENLRHYDPVSQKLIIQRPYFNARVKRSLPWDIVLCVDQSGSMSDSIIYAAVLAGIMAGLPGLTVKLVVFDTSIVDLTAMAHDPVELLLTVQLGGGTDIGRAVRYCEGLVVNPQRTIFALISDFCEGASPQPLLSAVRRMAESKVTLLGLAALDDQSHPIYDTKMAQRLVGAGMEVAALTPGHFAQWLGEVIQA